LPNLDYAVGHLGEPLRLERALVMMAHAPRFSLTTIA
jgi:hypothetical protein